jgi:hypothetical protein
MLAKEKIAIFTYLLLYGAQGPVFFISQYTPFFRQCTAANREQDVQNYGALKKEK